MEINNTKKAIESIETIIKNINPDTAPENIQYDATIPALSVKLAEAIFKDFPFLAPTVGKLLMVLSESNIVERR